MNYSTVITQITITTSGDKADTDSTGGDSMICITVKPCVLLFYFSVIITKLLPVVDYYSYSVLSLYAFNHSLFAETIHHNSSVNRKVSHTAHEWAIIPPKSATSNLRLALARLVFRSLVRTPSSDRARNLSAWIIRYLGRRIRGVLRLLARELLCVLNGKRVNRWDRWESICWTSSRESEETVDSIHNSLKTN